MLSAVAVALECPGVTKAFVVGSDVIRRVPALDAPSPSSKSTMILRFQRFSCSLQIAKPEHISEDFDSDFAMAEVAAGTYIAAEVVEHTAEAGYAAYIVSKPTLPLKVTFTRMATASGDSSE